MPDFNFLRDQFYKTFGKPDVPPTHLEASANSATGQFHNHLNSVGFLPVYTCPGATWGEGGCGPLCYARSGRGQMPSVLNRLTWNTRVLLRYCEKLDAEGLAAELVYLMDASVRQYENKLAKDGDTGFCRTLQKRGAIFRFLWAGDLMHPIQARAMVMACESRPHIQTWLYTRSFHLLPHLLPLPDNLRAWLSSDRVNGKEAQRAHRANPWTGLASMLDDRPKGVFACPKDLGKMGETPCAQCGMCYSGKRKHIWFKIKRFVTGAKPNPLLTIQEAA